MNITDVRYGENKIINAYFGGKGVDMPSLSFGKLFDYNDYLNIQVNYDYMPSSQYYCRYIKLKPNTTYVVSVDAGENTGLVLINNRRDVYVGTYIDLRKNTEQAKQYVTDESGFLYLGCSISLTQEQYNKIISSRNIKIKEK